MVVNLARANPTWGYDYLVGALANLGHEVSATSVANILKDHDIEPAPMRKKGGDWLAFLKAHWETLAATDFFTVEVWTPKGLVTYYVLFVMELATRCVCLAGITLNPHGAWMAQVVRNLTDDADGFLKGKTHLLMDRDAKFTADFPTYSGPTPYSVSWTRASRWTEPAITASARHSTCVTRMTTAWSYIGIDRQRHGPGCLRATWRCSRSDLI